GVIPIGGGLATIAQTCSLRSQAFFYLFSAILRQSLRMAFVQIKNPVGDRVCAMVAVRGGFEPPVP
ncbi:MAG: hypothetical protein RQ746_14080, partial [Bacteroidales bacterium]|nr:hypothetical protein [Bacteroidales bacterium]